MGEECCFCDFEVVEPGIETPEEHEDAEEECLASLELTEDLPLSLLLVVVTAAKTFLGDFDLDRKNLAIFRDLLLLGDFPLVSSNWIGITSGDKDWGGVASLWWRLL